MKWTYNNSTHTIWTSFDYGEVEADTYEEAKEKAIAEMKENIQLANDAFKKCPETECFNIEMNFKDIEVEEAE